MKLCIVLLAITLVALPAFSASPCAFACGPGHIFLENTSYPFIEDITLATQTVNSTWKSLHQTTCVATGGGDLNGNVTTNVAVRGYMKVSALSGVASGARWEMKLTIDGVEFAGSTRSFKNDKLTGSFLLPVSEMIAATALNVSAGRHVVELWAHMVDGGQFDVQDVYIQAQGVPAASYPAGNATASGGIAVATSTTQLTSTVRIDNTTASNLDIIPTAQYQLTGGTPGTAMTLWFRLTQIGGTGVTNGPDMKMYVPCEILTGGAGGVCSAPAGARDGATILGEYMSVPPGSWNLALYGYSASAATPPTIAWRYVDYASLPAPILYSGPTYENAIQKVRNTTPLTVSTSATGEQPVTWGGGCPFTKVLETTMPTSKAGDDENWNGALYIDFYRGSSGWGNWSDASITIVLEATTWDPYQNQYVTAEFGSYHTSLPPEGYGYYIFTSALLWGNYPQGNVVKVFVRKNSCASAASFEVRTRSLTLKRLPADANCYVIQ